MSDFDVVLNYLPPEGHPQDVEEDDCPYCALRRVETETERLKWMLDEACVDLADHESVWRNENASPPFKFVEPQAMLAKLKSRWEARREP